jgi:hypothetical protein
MTFRTLCFALFAAGCGGAIVDDSDAATDAATDTATTQDTSPPIESSDAGGPACNDTPDIAQTIPIEDVAGDPPPFASSGTASIFEGVYGVVSMTVYGSTSGNTDTIRTTVRVSKDANGGYVFDVVTAQDGAPPTRTSSHAVESSPGMLTVTQSCPAVPNVMTVDYAVNGQGFMVRVLGEGSIDEQLALLTN